MSDVFAGDTEGNNTEARVAPVSIPLVSSHGDSRGDTGDNGVCVGHVGKVGIAGECQVVRCQWKSM